MQASSMLVAILKEECMEANSVSSAVWLYFVFGDAQGFIQQWFVGENARCFNTTRRADDHLRIHDEFSYVWVSSITTANTH